MTTFINSTVSSQAGTKLVISDCRPNFKLRRITLQPTVNLVFGGQEGPVGLEDGGRLEIVAADHRGDPIPGDGKAGQVER